MIENQFTIEGMTCQSCVEKVTEKIRSLPQITKVLVSLENKLIRTESDHNVELNQIKDALVSLPKYSVFETATEASKPKPSVLKTYKPLIVVFSFILLISLSFQISQSNFNYHQFMNHVMAGFFLGFSLFKFLDLKAFSESFSSYDPIAQKNSNYGFIYPFIEFTLGIMYLNHYELFTANIITIIILTITTSGVIKRLQSKSSFQCACLGTAFSLPLSYVTVAENIARVLMAFYGLLSLS